MTNGFYFAQLSWNNRSGKFAVIPNSIPLKSGYPPKLKGKENFKKAAHLRPDASRQFLLAAWLCAPSALKRINNRIDNSFGFEKHFIRGQAKMKTRMGLALAVMMAMTLGHVKTGRIEQMRSLVQPIWQTA